MEFKHKIKTDYLDVGRYRDAVEEFTADQRTDASNSLMLREIAIKLHQIVGVLGGIESKVEALAARVSVDNQTERRIIKDAFRGYPVPEEEK
jgi:hypothetical protein|tara:strand:- start:128 stop:403 length:276 start_codon:yes stop_codon:yes gene_type:complete